MTPNPKKPKTYAERPWVGSYPSSVRWEIEPDSQVVPTLLDEAVARFSDRPCVYFLGRKITYAKLGELSDRAAKGLQALGIKPGDKVGLLLPNTPTYLIFYFGALKAGSTIVNYNPLYTVEELEFQVKDSHTKLLVTLDLALLFDKVEALLAKGVLDRAIVANFTEMLPALKSAGFKLLKRRQLAKPSKSPQRAKLVFERDVLDNDGAYERPTIQPQDVAVLQYTGGTTGTPKGAMLTHANLTANVQQVKAWRAPIPQGEERIVSVLPLFHVFAMTSVMNFGISEGAELILLPRFDLVQTLKTIDALKPTMLPGVPTLFNAMLRHPRIGNFDLTSLRFCISGGAALPIEVKRGFEALAECKLVEGYGLSETSPTATCNPLDRDPREGSIGLPLPGTEISIRSLDDPTVEVPLGEPGEICIAGPQVMRGYWNKPEETEQSFVGRFFRTGDVGYMDEEGFIFIVDRIKDMINASGYKIYPRQIEDALYEHEAVAEVTVIGVPDDYRGEAPKAFVKLKEGSQASPAELLDFLRPKISKIELPVEIELRDELPKTMIGKLSKKELRAEQKTS
jgi:long-chain acyl-CoA synthetase